MFLNHDPPIVFAKTVGHEIPKKEKRVIVRSYPTIFWVDNGEVIKFDNKPKDAK
jgi:hypothetical protein